MQYYECMSDIQSLSVMEMLGEILFWCLKTVNLKRRKQAKVGYHQAEAVLYLLWLMASDNIALREQVHKKVVYY